MRRLRWLLVTFLIISTEVANGEDCRDRGSNLRDLPERHCSQPVFRKRIFLLGTRVHERNFDESASRQRRELGPHAARVPSQEPVGVFSQFLRSTPARRLRRRCRIFVPTSARLCAQVMSRKREGRMIGKMETQFFAEYVPQSCHPLASGRLTSKHYRLMEVRMFRSLKLMITVLLLLGAGSISAQARGGPISLERRWNPQHIGGLPAEIRNAIASYARVCGSPIAAEHSFVRYFQSGTAKLIGLHFEHLRCADRAAVCSPAGCLHQVYISSGGKYRLLRSFYVPELDLTQVKIPPR